MPRVLVVDDDPDIRTTLTEILETEGYAVATASEGQEALAKLRREGSDLVVLDLMMPVMNGWQFRAEQRRDPALARIPVIAISAAAASPALDTDAFLPKPFDLEDLLALVARFAAPS